MTVGGERRIDEVLDTLELPGDGQVDRKRIVLPPGRWSDVDPFLMMAEDWFSEPGFDWHPHRGMQTVTLVLEGHQLHGDSTGGASVLGPDDAQWMTAGRGIIHRELAAGQAPVHSLQLWVNLPAALKMTEPHHQDLRRAELPVTAVPGGRVVTYAGAGSPAELVHPCELVDVQLDGPGAATLHVPSQWRAIVYVLAGAAQVGDATIADAQVGLSHPGEGDHLVVRAQGPTRALVFSGQPIGEPVVHHGPFVMNRRDEIDQAIEDLRAGRLAPAPGPSQQIIPTSD